MKDFYVFEELTGRILRKGTCSDELVVAQAGLGEKAFEGNVDFDLYYVDVTIWPYVLTAKTTCPATISSTTILADGVETVSIDSIPLDTTIVFAVPSGADEIEPMIVDDGTLTFSCAIAGEYTFTLSSIKFLSTTFTLTAS